MPIRLEYAVSERAISCSPHGLSAEIRAGLPIDQEHPSDRSGSRTLRRAASSSRAPEIGEDGASPLRSWLTVQTRSVSTRLARSSMSPCKQVDRFKPRTPLVQARPGSDSRVATPQTLSLSKVVQAGDRGAAIGLMYYLEVQAHELMRLPVPGDLAHTGGGATDEWQSCLPCRPTQQQRATRDERADTWSVCVQFRSHPTAGPRILTG
jgi:hypothetical protein